MQLSTQNLYVFVYVSISSQVRRRVNISLLSGRKYLKTLVFILE